MNVVKEAQGGHRAVLAAGDLELIHALARKELSEEEIYVFSVRLCDNEVDREHERFAPQTLEELAGLFVGKSGIFDHQWSARGQTARIYKTEVIREPDLMTRAGDEYCWLKAYAYMMRTEGNRDLIAEIEGGIKKEVSVGCSVERAVCSVCGAEHGKGDCGHRKGEKYDGKLCYASLEHAVDAYEFSFVAVPAQPKAGVIKSVVDKRPDRAALTRLEEEAACGRKYLEYLRGEVTRLAGLADGELDNRVIKSVVDKLSSGELEELAKSFGRQAEKRYPVKPQLSYAGKKREPGEADRAFLV